jgi:hypothetical protein
VAIRRLRMRMRMMEFAGNSESTQSCLHVIWTWLLTLPHRQTENIEQHGSSTIPVFRVVIFTCWAILTGSCLQKILTVRLSNSLRQLVSVINNTLQNVTNCKLEYQER